ncbi:MAG: hypothetical protein QXI12_04160 [Candidatus Methanomethyliaceae archaeon]
MSGEYEYLVSDASILREKPLNAESIMRKANEAKIYPIAVRVDNLMGQVILYFKEPLKDKEKRSLDEFMRALLKSIVE